MLRREKVELEVEEGAEGETVHKVNRVKSSVGWEGRARRDERIMESVRVECV